MAVGSPKKKVKKTLSHPTYSVMIAAAIKSLNERGGSSRQAILKYITGTYKIDATKAGTQVRMALKRAVASGSLKQAKGVGASGSFKLPSAEVKPKKKVVKKTKAAVAKKPAAKKTKKPKKSKKVSVTAKKSPKKLKKAKKPVAKKVKKSPKKVRK